jgi:hypothetical protein
MRGAVVSPTTVSCCQPLGAPTLTGEQAEATAALFKALGDPARVKIVAPPSPTWRERAADDHDRRPP